MLSHFEHNIKAIRNYQCQNSVRNHNHDYISIIPAHLEHDAGDEPRLRRIVSEEVVDGAQVYRLLLG